ncbi:MAG: hypothetical protein ACRDIB_06095, partial [Ardenticatenaceae bacterium]
EITERDICARCGRALPNNTIGCHFCNEADDLSRARALSMSPDSASRGDWMERFSEEIRLTEMLWQQCQESQLSDEEREIACHLISDLDEHGYLMSDPAEHAAILGEPLDRVEKVRRTLLHFEPLGIGARNAQECLRVQAEVLARHASWAEVARRLITEQWDALMRGELRQAARALGLSLPDVERAFSNMLDHFYLYPAYGCHGQVADTLYVQPDARFRLHGRGSAATIEVEILESQRYGVNVTPEYRHLLAQPAVCDGRTWELLTTWHLEVRRIAAGLGQRWKTLAQVCQMIADFQRDFFLSGCCPDTLRPLTRDEVATALGVHPSTVGRAVNGKFVELPRQQVVPLSFFFDSSAPIHALIARLIAEETTLLSDESLRAHLQRAGWAMTRRAVAMHRETMGILPAYLRRRQRQVSQVLRRKTKDGGRRTGD